ncbi:MAG: DUF4231 domain-containing protein [Trichodesmium sp. MAG_R04]|nr:DUF4231 domain-containing protein [Trichodesmium sp. MAG_R04]
MNDSDIKASMTSSEMIDSQSKNNQIDILKPQPPKPGILPFLRILSYLSFVITIALSITIFVLPSNVKLLIVLAVSLSLFIFLFFVSQDLHRNYTRKLSDYNVLKATDTYINIANLEDSPKITQIMQEVEIALNYTQRLIEESDKTRRNTKYFYYVLQIITIIFSAVTPILVLIEKSNTTPLLKWLPVILPAIASVIASISTSFPFEETWLSSRKALESLEAEKEKFLLGVSPGYRIPRFADENDRYKMARNAMAKFINKVSSIHLKQLKEEEAIDKQAEEEKQE